jgi:hypothetical protein
MRGEESRMFTGFPVAFEARRPRCGLRASKRRTVNIGVAVVTTWVLRGAA